MNRENFEQAVRRSRKGIAKQSLIQVILFFGWMVGLIALLTLYPFESQESRFTVGFPVWVGCLILWLWYGGYKDKSICKSNKLVCSSCNKVYRQDDFLHLILENQCKVCNGQVYET